MSSSRTTIMILVPGRNAISFDAPRIPPGAVVAALLLPLFSGAAAERCFRSLRSGDGGSAIASLARLQLPNHEVRTVIQPAMMGSFDSAPQPQLQPAPDEPKPMPLPIRAAAAIVPVADALVPSLTFATTAPLEVASKAVVSAKDVLRALSPMRHGLPADSELERVPINGTLRIQALHFDESIDVRPFDEQLQLDPVAMGQVNHLLRCRVTGNEIGIDPRLVSVLTQLTGLYGKTIQLISGHRVARTLHTKPTSQHALGRAADIRIPGVSINDLKRVAIKLGARGVGVYPEKGFVHVDVREKKYFWRYTEAGGEQPDMGMTRPAPAPSTKPANDVTPAPDSEDESEGDEVSGEAAHVDPNAEHPAGTTPSAEPHLEAEHGAE